MKKALSFLAAGFLVLSLGACSSKEESKETKTTSGEVKKDETQNKETRTALLTYQSEVLKVVRTVEGKLTDGQSDPVEAVSTIGTDLKAVAIPEELKDYSADLESALDNLTKYYTKKGELLKAKSTDTTETDKLKDEYINGVTKVFDAVELTPPNFTSVFVA